MTLGILKTIKIDGLKMHAQAAIVPDMQAEAFTSFLADVKEHGIKTPLDVLDDGTVLDGRHRLKAARRLKLERVPVRVLDLKNEDPVEFMFRAAAQRRDLNADQRAMMGLEMSAYRGTRDAAKAKQKEHGGTAPGRKSLVAALPQVSSKPSKDQRAIAALEAETHRRPPAAVMKAEAAKSRAFVANSVQVSPRTVQNAIAIKKAAETNPEVADMLPKIKAGEVSVGDALKWLKLEKKKNLAASLRAEPLPAPDGPYRVIVTDPPWQYEKRAEDITHRGRNPYPDMTIEEICALPVGALAHDDCVLWLWTTNAFMRDAYKCLDAWGFKEKTILTWVKDRMGTGDWLRGKSEHCILAVRGKPAVTLTNQTTVLAAALREHSRKPDEFYSLVEALCPGTKLEMFAREPRPGWAAWGAEKDKFSATA